jgi:hypothetical protein
MSEWLKEHAWKLNLAAGSKAYQNASRRYKRNLDIVQQDRDGLTPCRWSLSRA